MKKKEKKKHRKVGRWAFAIGATAVAVLTFIKGEPAYACWPILAAFFHWMADVFEELSEKAIEYGDAMAQANIEMSNELVKAQLQVVELQDAITDALDTLEDVTFELENVKETAKIKEWEKVIDSLVTKVRCVRSDLGRV